MSPLSYEEALAFWYGRINYEVKAATPEDAQGQIIFL